MGYVQEDQIWHYKYELKQLFNSIVAIKGYDVTLDMPYEWITKSDILSMQEAEIPSNCVWHCESPKKVGRGYKACGACYSCRTHDLAIYKRESWGIGNRDISES
jgi:7-cyano-7-deazaguanine synthase in queuosine biosynthesis